ncbi:MAG: hypothetical protein HS126_35325 [Anaerolineales bacterium]|nr:hypothetical protein [Anaerolineales bacterium]
MKNRAVAIRLQRPLPPGAVFPHRRNWRADLTDLLSYPLAEAKNKTDTSPDDDRLPRSVSRCNVVPASG